MNWKEFTSKKRDGLFISFEPTSSGEKETIISSIYYDPSPSPPYNGPLPVLNWGHFVGDDSEVFDDEAIPVLEKSEFFEIPEDSELFEQLNNYLEKLYGDE